MIGEQYALPARARKSRAAARPSVASAQARPTRTAHAAVAGRERLAQALDRSVLAQLVLAMTCVAVALLLYLAQASQASVLEFRIAALESARTQLTAQNATLHASATALQSLQRIDSAATNRFHMIRPDLSTTLWIRPIIPSVRPLPPANADRATAQQRSQPLAWMIRFMSAVKSSL